MITKFKNSAFARYGIVWLAILCVIFFSIALPNFATLRNFNVLMVGRVAVGFFALAALVPLVAGEFDISLGYMLGTAIMFGAKMSTFGLGPAVVILVALLTAILLGCLNGFLSVYLKIPSTISTLGTGQIFYGLSILIGNSRSISSALPKSVTSVIKSRYLGFNLSVWVLLLTAVLLWYVMERTPFGKQIYAVGMSERVAYLSGVDTKFVRFMSFVIAGIIMGIGAVMILGQSGNAYPDTGPTYLMPGLATVFLSITTHKIGRYNVVGAMAALILLSIVFNGVGMMGSPFWFEGVANGIILLGVVLLNGAEARHAQTG